jgi:periplasmic copper chaperone A
MRIARIAPFALLALAACHGPAKLSADDAWVRLPAVPGNPGAGYLTIHGGPEPARLVAVESQAAGSTELHASMKMGGDQKGMGAMMGMQRLDGVDVPANGAVKFAPDGNHVMMFGLSPKLKAGDTVPFSVRFEKGQPLTIQAKVVGAGDAAPY